MQSLARLLLAFACLLLGPLAVIADELPKDTNKITSLTPEQAKRLVETFPGVIAEFGFQGTAVLQFGGCLPLNGLKKITPDVAQALSGYSNGPLLLNGLTTLDAATAKALAKFKGQWLLLDGLKTLDADTAKALAEFKGQWLYLNGLTTLDADTAKAIAKFEGQWLSLSGLTTLDAAAAKALAEFKRQGLHLDGMTTLDADTAKALAEFKGRFLYLCGLTTLDAATAKALAAFKGQWLIVADEAKKAFFKNNPLTLETALAWAAVSGSELTAITAFDAPDSVAIAQVLATWKGPLALPNLKKISPKTLTALIEKRDVQIPRIETLELIQEPDGSVTEDFVIPEWLEERQKQQRRQQAK